MVRSTLRGGWGRHAQTGFEPYIFEPPRAKNSGWKVNKHNWRLVEELLKPVTSWRATTIAAAVCWRLAAWPKCACPKKWPVIGVDNDELFCELADPPLSSVALNTEHGDTARLICSIS